MLFDVLNSIILKGVERAKSQQKQQINRARIGKNRLEWVQKGDQRKQVNKLEIEMAAGWQSARRNSSEICLLAWEQLLEHLGPVLGFSNIWLTLAERNLIASGTGNEVGLKLLNILELGMRNVHTLYSDSFRWEVMWKSYFLILFSRPLITWVIPVLTRFQSPAPMHLQPFPLYLIRNSLLSFHPHPILFPA